MLRFQNMINSDIPELMRLASKRLVFDAIHDPDTSQLLVEKLEGAMTLKGDKLEIDTASWMIKALSVGQCWMHVPLFSQLAEGATAKKIRKYASQAAANCQ